MMGPLGNRTLWDPQAIDYGGTQYCIHTHIQYTYTVYTHRHTIYTHTEYTYIHWKGIGEVGQL